MCFIFSGVISVPPAGDLQVFGKVAFNGYRLIHLIQGWDLSLDNDGASLLAIDPEVFGTSTSVHLQSQISAPINFRIRIFGAGD